jgi:hypothetical protein
MKIPVAACAQAFIYNIPSEIGTLFIRNLIEKSR